MFPDKEVLLMQGSCGQWGRGKGGGKGEEGGHEACILVTVLLIMDQASKSIL